MLAAVTIDGEEQDVDQAFQVTKGAVVASFNPTVPDAGEVLEVSNDMYDFTLTAVRSFEDETSGYNRYLSAMIVREACSFCFSPIALQHFPLACFIHIAMQHQGKAYLDYLDL